MKKYNDKINNSIILYEKQFNNGSKLSVRFQQHSHVKHLLITFLEITGY